MVDRGFGMDRMGMVFVCFEMILLCFFNFNFLYIYPVAIGVYRSGPLRFTLFHLAELFPLERTNIVNRHFHDLIKYSDGQHDIVRNSSEMLS